MSIAGKQLFKVVENGNLEKVYSSIFCFEILGVKLGVKDLKHAVFLAASRGFLEIVKYLLTQTDSREPSVIGMLAACQKGHLDVVKYLIDYGVDVSVGGNQAIRLAGQNGHFDVVKYLIDEGADYSTDDSFTLRIASQKGHLDVVKYLVHCGDDLSADGNHVIEMSKECGNDKIFKYALNYVLNEMKTQTLLLLLNKNRKIHKDLITIFKFKYQEHYDVYRKFDNE